MKKQIEKEEVNIGGKAATETGINVIKREEIDIKFGSKLESSNSIKFEQDIAQNKE